MLKALQKLGIRRISVGKRPETAQNPLKQAETAYWKLRSRFEKTERAPKANENAAKDEK